MSRLTRDGTTEPVSRDQILRHERGQGNIHFPVQLTTCRTGILAWLIHTLAIRVTIHTYRRVSYDFIGSRNCVPMAFTAESPLCPNIIPAVLLLYKRKEFIVHDTISCMLCFKTYR